MNTDVSPTSLKSCSETKKVAVLTVSSPMAERKGKAIECSLRSEREIVLEADLLHRGIGVLPTDDEDSEPVVHEELDQAIVRLHIQHIIFVDPGGINSK